MNARIVIFWRTLTVLLSVASVGFLVCGFFAAWFALSLLSNAGGILACDGHGRLFGCTFDPGGNYGNALQNYLQLLLLFANLSLTTALGAGVAETQTTVAKVHAHANAIRKHLEASSSKRRRPTRRV